MALTKALLNQKDIRNSKKRSLRKRKAKLLGTHQKWEWEEMLEYFNLCVRCGDDTCKLVKDHIIPIYQGGSDSIKNIQPLCSHCNSSKGAEDIDWRSFACEKIKKEMKSFWL